MHLSVIFIHHRIRVDVCITSEGGLVMKLFKHKYSKKKKKKTLSSEITKLDQPVGLPGLISTRPLGTQCGLASSNALLSSVTFKAQFLSSSRRY